ncbi:MAG: ABC transporter substrate-binding protein [Christensenellales bacterium]
MSKKLAIFLALAMILGFGVGCASSEGADPEAAATGETFLFVDSCGREVELPANITRVAPSGSVAQMILYTVTPETLVGWSSELGSQTAAYISEEFFGLPVLGQFYGGRSTLNMEALIAADPQVIIDLGEMKKSHKEDMDDIQERTGIPTIFIEANLETFPQAYRTLGELLGCEEAAEAIAQYIETTVADVRAVAATIPEEERVAVMFGTGESGLDCNAKGSIHADVIELVGGENAVVVEELSGKGGGNTISLEQVMVFDPDVILFASGGPYATVGSDPAWGAVRAIRENRYYEIPAGPYHWLANPPSVNRIVGIKWLAELLYPDYYDYDVAKETKAFYSLFWHYELTDAEVDAFLENSIHKRSAQ